MREADIMKGMLYAERRQHKLSEDTIALINMKCHDLKHQVSALCRQGQVDPALMEEIGQTVAVYDSDVQTGNGALDVVLTEKSFRCEREHISFSCMLDGRLFDFMAAADIYSLFGNALDNAIESVVGEPEDHRFISIKAGSQKVSLFSESTVDLIYGGTGSGAIDTSTVPTLKEAFESIGYTVNPTLWDFYRGNHEKYSRVIPSNLPGFDHAYFVNECPVSEYTQAVKDSFSSYGDAAIVVISRSGGEGLDLITASTAPDGNYLALTQEELDVLDMIQNNDAFDKIIIVLNACNPVELGFLSDYSKIQACLWAGNLGQVGIESLVRVFNGEINPSGRLVDTYAFDAFSSPAMQNFGETNVFLNASEVPDLTSMFGNELGNIYVAYAEGIYVGYKYYETRYEDVVLGQGNAGSFDYAAEVAYPFGYGLSTPT